VIAIVSNTATREKQPEGLKMTTHSGHVLFDSSWIAGVDYDEQFVQEATIEYKEEESDTDDDSKYETEDKEDESDNENSYCRHYVEEDNVSVRDAQEENNDQDGEDNKTKLVPLKKETQKKTLQPKSKMKKQTYQNQDIRDLLFS
jgi:hypothetical protein